MAESLKISCYSCGQKFDVGDLDPFTKFECSVCRVGIIVPKPFGDLLLEEDLGRGPMAQVFRAMDITLDREIAVKMLNEELTEDSEAPQRFLNEARLASAINHPNVIPIYNSGEMANQTYITMQFMEGGNLLGRLEAGLPNQRDVCKWFYEAVKGLESAYIHGVAHHNIKPSNIFLDIDANVKVSDFGLSQVLDQNQALFENDQVHPSVGLEMSYYVSPEKISTGRQDMAGDIYSLGASLYHVVCGRPPFPGETPDENIKARFAGLPPEAKTFREDINPALNELLNKMLAVYPSDRPGSYGEISAALEETLQQLVKKRRAAQPGLSSVETVPDRDRFKGVEKAVAKKPKFLVRKKIIPVPAEADEADEPASPTRSSTVTLLLRLIPLVVICLVILLAIAHVKRFAWYERSIRPVLENIFGGGDAGEEDAGEDGSAPIPASVPEED